MIDLIWLAPLFVLIGFLINVFFGKALGKSTSGITASAAVFASFVIALLAFNELQHTPVKQHVISLGQWISSGTLQLPFEFLYDPLSSLFLLIITGIGFLIHVYSIGYMSHDEGVRRFFIYLNLFVFFMLLLVMANNYILLFVGWEGVGLCSYLLIGFWFKNEAYNDAAKKAFIMNRIGDLGFLIGAIIIYLQVNSLSFTEVFSKANAIDPAIVTTIAICLFIGAVGKSAQIPLFTWLPDAMAGPTPVSALIHAATMVTAGIYLVARSNVFFNMSPMASEIVAYTGAITALLAAIIAVAQNDIKKILAYSTVSQLGIMFIGLGVHAYSSAVFHVTTHAFFKALLFLGAGSVIHAMSGEQDIRNMGGLKANIKITFVTMLIGSIAISGIPPFSGFFSKDEILAHTYSHSPILWSIGMVASLLTAFYMFRMMYLTFYGSFRGTSEQKHHLHESPLSMTLPLMILAVLSIIGGLLGLPEFLGFHNWIGHYLMPSLQPVPHGEHLSHAVEISLMTIAAVGALFSIGLAYYLYRIKGDLPKDPATLTGLPKLASNKFYIDEIYDSVVKKPLDSVASFSNQFIESKVIDGQVNGVGTAVQTLGRLFSYLQTGNISFYIAAMVLGIIAILAVLLIL